MALLGLTIACTDNLKGGIKYLYATEKASVVSMTKGTGVESYATITMATGAVFKKYEFEEDTCSFKPVTEAVRAADLTTTTIDADFGKLGLLAGNVIREFLSKNACGFILIVELYSGEKFVVGYNEADTKEKPARVSAVNGDSKLERNDPNSTMITFTQKGSEWPRTFTGTVPIT